MSEGKSDRGNTVTAADRPLHNLLFGDHLWAKRRLLIVLSGLLVFFLLGLLIDPPDVTAAVAQRQLEYGPSRGLWLPLLYSMGAMVFNLHSLRYFLPPLSALVLIFLLGASYIQDIYELERYRTALHYLWASLFGWFYPRITIDQGQVQPRDGEASPLDVIGGPGIIWVNPGNVVLLENLTGDIRIAAEGRQPVQRFETIRDIAYLKDFQGSIEEISAFSQDGIRVVAREVRYRFRIRFSTTSERTSASAPQRTKDNPYPFSQQALLNMAANRMVGADGPVSWPETIQRIVRGTIAHYINVHPIDYLTAPRVKNLDPRGELIRSFFSEEFDHRMEAVGAELVWIDIGYFDIPEAIVNQQRLEAWRTSWLRDANLLRAYGKAKHQAYQELGRAQAQAELLMSIAHALEDIGASQDHKENLRKLILLRTAQVIDAFVNHASDEIGGKSISGGYKP